MDCEKIGPGRNSWVYHLYVPAGEAKIPEITPKRIS